jgi:hypothetical protein
MEDRTLMETKIARTQSGKQLRLEYYLTGNSERGCGLEVRAVADGGEERASVPDLAPSPARVQELLRRLADGLVTPTSVMDIVQDWL